MIKHYFAVIRSLGESGRSWVKVDGLLTESERFFRKWTVRLKMDGLSESGRSFRKWTVSE